MSGLELEGYLTGIIVAPVLIQPSRWRHVYGTKSRSLMTQRRYSRHLARWGSCSTRSAAEARTASGKPDERRRIGSPDESRPQRSLPLRVWQEIQALLRAELNALPAGCSGIPRSQRMFGMWAL